MPLDRSIHSFRRTGAIAILTSLCVAAGLAGPAFAGDPQPPQSVPGRDESGLQPGARPKRRAVPEIGPEEARKFVGKEVRATLRIRKTKKSDETKRTYLDSELDYKDPKNLGILIEDADLPTFTKADIPKPHVHYKDRTIRVVGKPFLEDDTVFIRVKDPAQIEVLKPADKQ